MRRRGYGSMLTHSRPGHSRPCSLVYAVILAAILGGGKASRHLRLEAPSRSGAAALWAPAQGYGRLGPAAPPRSLSEAPFTCWPHWLGQSSRYGIAHLDGGTHRAAETAIAEAVEAVARSRRGRHRAGRAEEIGRSEQEGAPVCRSVVTPRPHASIGVADYGPPRSIVHVRSTQGRVSGLANRVHFFFTRKALRPWFTLLNWVQVLRCLKGGENRLMFLFSSSRSTIGTQFGL